MSDKEQDKRDAVTIGQIRRRYLRLLDDQIDTLGKLIRQEGYHGLGKHEAFLHDSIGETLTKLDNLNSYASTEVLFPGAEKK